MSRLLAVPRVRHTLVAGVAVAAVVVGTTVYLDQRDDGAAADSGTDPATGTATVERRDLVDAERVSGTLEYADSFPVLSTADGTLTELPAEGAQVGRGEAVYRVDDVPVVLLLGDLPMWRDLYEGVADGKDVRQLERNLEALGYDPGTVNTEFTGYTEAALLDFQEDRGLDETGIASPGAFVVAPEPLRVGAHTASEGQRLSAAAPAELFTASSLDQVVTVDLDPDDESMARIGAAASVTLPDGTEVEATIESVGEVETETAADGSETSTIPVRLVLDARKKDLSGMNAATVSVDLTRQTRKNVLAVPVTALVALAEGGYGVQRVTDGEPVLTAVEPGLYADGYVEIVDGLAEGDTVVVPE